MNESSSDVVAPARTELTTPANSTPNATSAIAIAASQAEREASVPRHTNTPPVTASAACARSRARIGPAKSTSSSIANEPNAANVANAGLPITRSPSANIAGMTSAGSPRPTEGGEPAIAFSQPPQHRHVRHTSGWIMTCLGVQAVVLRGAPPATDCFSR